MMPQRLGKGEGWEGMMGIGVMEEINVVKWFVELPPTNPLLKKYFGHKGCGWPHAEVRRLGQASRWICCLRWQDRGG